ncbi:MAG: tail fiber assembly protein [Kluyvera sp.]|uniref:tail fiber assembly protein n=1 Tax=Kluyvera sp. TaxID=1538228 RepID=UPI003F32171B
MIAKTTAMIPLLERAVKLGMATDQEIAFFKAWEEYSVLLMRIDLVQAPDIERPVKSV